ncbi:hypothetical protein [Mycetocola zhujimingii]|uniref:hypothetical protein n=1 Tax=Mycetocola zhujimingii TaxID=2079792 RepID=UPI001E2DB990|nr:hypothetical protein [Mycetocola zhujimingii]
MPRHINWKAERHLGVSPVGTVIALRLRRRLAFRRSSQTLGRLGLAERGANAHLFCCFATGGPRDGLNELFWSSKPPALRQAGASEVTLGELGELPGTDRHQGLTELHHLGGGLREQLNIVGAEAPEQIGFA